MSNIFQKAERKKSKLRLAIAGASGSGKTYSALALASGIGGKIAVLDTENGSASLYSDKFEFDVVEFGPPYSPERYSEVVAAAEKAGYDVLIMDSITPEWSGPGGCLEIKTKLGDGFKSWGVVTQKHEKFLSSIIQSKIHIIVTLRTKSAYEIKKDEKGKTEIQKIGTEPVQRDGIEFEFTTVFDLSMDHTATSCKDRTGIFDGQYFTVTEKTGQQFLEWLNKGVEKQASPDPVPVSDPSSAPAQAPEPATKPEHKSSTLPGFDFEIQLPPTAELFKKEEKPDPAADIKSDAFSAAMSKLMEVPECKDAPAVLRELWKSLDVPKMKLMGIINPDEYQKLVDYCKLVKEQTEAKYGK